MVIGCDQVLAFDKSILSKPTDPDDAARQLRMMRGQRHMLLSAAVIYHESKPIWRHVGQVRLADARCVGWVSRRLYFKKLG